MTAVCYPSYGYQKSRRFDADGFSFLESLVSILILGIMLSLTVGTMDSLRSTSRLTAAQNLASALEEARSEALRHESSVIFFRQSVGETGVAAYREFGLLQTRGDVDRIIWRQMPQGIVLWAGLPKEISSGTNVITLPPQIPMDHGFAGLGTAGSEAHVAIIFGDLGQVTFPTSLPQSMDSDPTPGPYYLCVAEEAQIQGRHTPANMQVIEIRASTGRAQLLP